MRNQYTNGDLLDVKIEKIVPNGPGLAFAENLTIFVPLAAADDKLRVRIEEIKGKTAFAEIEDVIEPSPDRITPPCVYYGRCGGCNFQHLAYEAQLNAKLGIVRDCFKRIAKISDPFEIAVVPSPEPFGYRLRALWHVDTRNKKIGYYRRNSRDLIDIERCMILAPELQQKLDFFRSNLSWEEFWGEKAQIEAACGDDGEVSVFSAQLVEPTSEIKISAGGEAYFFSARSFFQGNRFLIEKLIETAIGEAAGETALDLYCGVGLFSLPLARKFKNVTGIEDSEEAIHFANKNAANAGLQNVEFRAERVCEFLGSVSLKSPDFVLLDPPRAGTEKETLQNLIKLRPKKISYVACEPSVLARDLRRLLDTGFRIDSVTAIDLFPQTHHIETVVQLSSV